MTSTASVRAVVVATARSDFLPATLHALATQQRGPAAVDIVIVGGAVGDEPEIPAELSATVMFSPARTFGEAVTGVLRERPPLVEDEWLWLLHADSAPEREALWRLVAIATKRRRAGVVGPTQVGWDDPRRLVNVGSTVSRRGGRRLSLAGLDDLDQGQHEGREDVLAVGLAGAIVRRSLWERLDGTDPAYGRFGDSLDFCRRAWRAGADVVLAPRARVRHAQESLYGRRGPEHARADARATYATRRAAEWYHGLAWGPGWRVVPALLWGLFAALGRAAFRIAANDPRMITAETRVPLLLWPMLGHLGASRRRIAAAGARRKPPVETPLLAGTLEVLAHARARELGAYEQWRAETAPTDVQRTELKALAARRRWTLAAVAATLGAIAFAQYGTWLAPLIRGDMLTGQAMGATYLTAAELWHRTWTGWSDAGLGSAALDGSWSALMLPLSLGPGGLALGLGLLLALSPLLAGLAAWFGAGALTRSVVARALAALAWATLPFEAAAVADGRVGAVIAHILLPLFGLAIARAVGRHARDRLGDGSEFPAGRLGSPSAAAAAAVLLAALVAAAPVLLAPLVLIVVLVGLAARGQRRALLFVPLPALVVSGPALVYAFTGPAHWWEVLAREPGPTLASDPASPFDLLWGVVRTPPAWPRLADSAELVLVYLPGVAVVVAAALALASGRRGAVVRWSWVVAGGGLALAIAGQRLLAAPLGADGSPAANGWPGPALSLAAAGFLAAAVAASRIGVWVQAARGTRVAASVAAGFAALLLGVHVAATIWPGRDFGGDVHLAQRDVLPLVAQIEFSSDPGTRALVVWQDAAGSVSYTVLARDGSTALLGRPFLDAAAEGPESADLAGAVATLLAAGDGGAAQLREWGVGMVVVAPDAETALNGLLRSDEVARLGASDLGQTWRLLGAGDAIAPRAWLIGADGERTSVRTLGGAANVRLDAAAGDRRLVVAVDPKSGWAATFAGTELVPGEDAGRLSYTVPGGEGRLELEYHDGAYRAWWLAGAILLAWTVLSAIPVHDRRFRGVRP